MYSSVTRCDGRGKHDRRGQEVRSSEFEVQKTSNFEPRTVANLTRPAFLASLACLASTSRLPFGRSLGKMGAV
jgi:hypothetical protein